MKEVRPAERVPFTARITVPETVLLQELEGECVALNLESELYLGLNQSGTQILNELKEATSIQAAYERLLEKYEVAPQELRETLSQFIEKLLEQGLIELSPP